MFDPLWMLTRQWQMGEFQAEDAGTPIQARVRATTATLCRRFSGELPKSATPAPAPVAAQPLRSAEDAARGARRAAPHARGRRATDARMLTFAVESGLHFLRMLELAGLSKSYRAAFITRLALQPLSAASSALVDDASARYMQSMVGRAPDGRQLAALLRTIGAAQLVADPALNIAVADRPKVQQAATTLARLVRLDVQRARRRRPTMRGIRRGWNMRSSVGARLSANPGDEMTFSASEIDGPIDWSSFDVTTPGAADDRCRSGLRVDSSRRRSPRR